MECVWVDVCVGEDLVSSFGEEFDAHPFGEVSFSAVSSGDFV